MPETQRRHKLRSGTSICFRMLFLLLALATFGHLLYTSIFQHGANGPAYAGLCMAILVDVVE
jgi:hypothetical protein